MLEFKPGMRFRNHPDESADVLRIVALNVIKQGSLGFLNERTNEVETSALNQEQCQASVILRNLREIR